VNFFTVHTLHRLRQ